MPATTVHFHPFPNFGTGAIVLSSICRHPGNRILYPPRFLWKVLRFILTGASPLSQFISLVLSPFACLPLFSIPKEFAIVLHGRSVLLLSVPFVILNRLILRKRVFYQPHTYLKPAHAPLLNAFFDGIVLLSKRNQLLIKEKLLHAKTVVIYNPIPVILAARDPKAKPVYDFLFVGRDVPCKRMGMFLSAMATLRAKGCLVTTGFSDEGNRIAAERLAHDGKLDIRLGLSLESIHKTYGKSKIFVFPSNAEEGFGIVVLEAAHFGLEILAEDNPKNRELFGHEISYFSGQKELASKMAKLVSKSRLRKYSFLARYSPASVAKGYASLSLQAPSGSAL